MDIKKEYTGAFSGSDNDNSVVSPSGFGFIPKYEQPAPKLHKKVRDKKPSLSEPVKDVAIWSDDETNEQRNEKRITANLRMATPSHNDQKTVEIQKISQKSPNCDSIDRDKSNQGSEKQSYDDYDHESDDNESLVHEPLSATKKTFVFNIKLPKQEAFVEEAQSKTLTEALNQDIVKNEIDNSPAFDQFDATSPVLPNDTVTSSTSNDVITTSNTTDVIANSIPNDSQMSDQAQMMNPYNPYMMHSHFMGPRAMMPHPLYYQFMNYHARQPFAQMDFSAPLPEHDQPPLPGDGK